MLSFAEEILLLALDDESGGFVPLPANALDFALTSAVLMELAQAGRIDTDLEQLVVVSDEPLGDPVLDPILAAIARSKETYNAQRWVSVLAQEATPIRERALDKLVERGILRREKHKLLWVLGKRRYPVVDSTEQREVKLRILGIVLSDEIPDPRDVVIIALADACRLFDEVLSPRELKSARPRIEQVAKMDLIGQALVAALREMREWGRWAGSPRENVWGDTPD